MLPRCASLSFSYLAYVAHEIRLQAVANGDLSKQIEVDAQGEILDLKNTVNGMVIRLRALAAEVTRVTLEVGSQGKLGGQAVVPDVEGVWEQLTVNVRSLLPLSSSSRIGYLDLVDPCPMLVCTSLPRLCLIDRVRHLLEQYA